MKTATWKALIQLVRVDVLITCGTLETLHRVIRCCPVSPTASGKVRLEALCTAMEMACVLYPKQVLCLQRSAAATLLLRSYGIPAELVIGAQLMPFRSHAWVEVSRTVVNDRPYIHQMYTELARC
jgi:hypothetical protein